MTNSIDSYRVEIELMDQIISEPTQIFHLSFSTRAAATAFRHRIYKARVADRAQSRATRDLADPLYGFSPYDIIRIAPPALNGTIWTLSIQAAKSARDIVGLLQITKTEKEKE